MLSYVPRYWKQIVALLIITPILTEVLTNNIPAHKLLEPKTFLLFATVVYGPVLVLRELAVRWRLGLTGYIILGLVYGIYNEGLLGKTIFQMQVPNPSFNNYGFLFGINFTWATVIAIFHAFYAFLFPLLIINYIFPLAARKPWLDRRVWFVMSGAFIAYVSLKFLRNMHPSITSLHYVFLIIITTGLVMLAKKFQNKKMFEVRKTNLLLLCFYGVAFVITVFVFSNLIAVSRVSAVVFIIYMLAVLCITIISLHKENAVKSLLLFCLSAEIAFTGCTLLVAIASHSRKGIETSICFIIIFLSGLIVVVRKRDIPDHRLNNRD